MPFEFEDQFTEAVEDIRRRIFDNIEALWLDPDNRPDVREGSLLWTIFYPLIFEVQVLQVLLNRALELGFLQFTIGEFLDLKGLEIGLDRKQGSPASGIVRFLGDIGVLVPTGTEVSTIDIGVDEESFTFATIAPDVLVGVEDPEDVNEVQEINITGSGTFKITFDGVETSSAFSETDVGTTIATALSTEIEPTTNFPTVNVTGDSGILNAGGAKITFDGGDVAGNDVPLMLITSITGTIASTVEEITKGRDATSVLSTTNQNEIQKLIYTPTDLEATELIVGSDGSARNEIQRVSFNGTPTSGSIDVTFDNGTTTDTGTILSSYGTVGITGALEGLTNMLPGDVLVTLVSGGPLIEDGSAVFDIELKGNYRFTNFSNSGTFIFSNNTLSPATPTPVTSVIQDGASGVNAKHQLEYFNGFPSAGVFSLTLDDGVSGTETLTDIPYNVTAGILASMLETLVTYANGTDPNGTNFLILGGGANGLASAPIAIEYRGKNRATDFEVPVLGTQFTGAPTSGVFKLIFDDTGLNSQTTANIAYNATPATVQTALEGLSNISPGEVSVNLVLGGPNLDTLGTVYEIEWIGVKALTNFNLMTTTGSTLAPVPASPTVIAAQDGTAGQNEKQLLTLSHPLGVFKANFGGSAPTRTSYLSTIVSTASDFDTELETLGDIGVGELTVTGGPLISAPILVEFSGGTVAGIDHPNIVISDNSVVGGVLGSGPNQATEFSQDQIGFGGAGLVSGNVRYGYSLVTKIGVQDTTSDPDFEDGFGETSMGATTNVLAVANNKILVAINPILRTSGLQEIRVIRVYRSLNSGPFKLIDEIPEDEISFTFDGDLSPPSFMYSVDNLAAGDFAAVTTTAPASNSTGVVDIESEAIEIGDEANIPARTIQILEDFISGIAAVTNPEPFGGGSDVESDDDYRERLLEEVRKDPGAGNIDDYIGWAKDVAGINSVSVIPEWQEIYGPLEGPGTVKVIVAGPNVTLVDDATVEDVRQHIAGTIAIPDPNQEEAPATLAIPGGAIEDGIYEYVYTFINVGKGETKPTPASRVTVGTGNNSVEITLEQGQRGIGVLNTIGRRVYRRKVDDPIVGEPDSSRYVLVTEILDNEQISYSDSDAYLSLPTWTGFPSGPYQRRKAPITNSTSLYDGESPIGAHVTVESITAETIFVNAEIYPESGFSVDGTGGTVNLTNTLDDALAAFFATLPAGQDVLIVDIENVIHDQAGVKDFRNTTMFSPAFPLGTTENIAIGPGVSASYSAAGTFTYWSIYPYDR